MSTRFRARSTVCNADAQRGVRPVNWTNGQQVIIVPALSDAGAKERFPRGQKILMPHLRVIDEVKLPHEAA